MSRPLDNTRSHPTSMLLRSWKFTFALGLGVVLLFVSTGYLMSDDLFFNRLIRSNRITSPEEAFAFVQNQTDPVAPGMSPINGLTPRYMLTQRKKLYCDEGAVLMATIVYELGYPTRLVDLVDVTNGVGRHTILEVHQNGAWKTYDTLRNLQGITYEQSAEFYQARPVYRAYPRTYNWLIQNNFYLKHIALWLRRIPG